MSVVINIVLSAARWSRDRQFSYILLMTFSGKLFPLIFRPHILEVERSVSSGTLRCEQSHHKEVPGWRARYKMGFAGRVIKTAPRDGWGSGGSGGSFLPSLEQDQGGFSSFVTFFFFLFQTFWLEESSVLKTHNPQGHCQRRSRCSLHRQTDGHTQLPVPVRAEQPGLLGGVPAHGRGWN